MQISGGSTPLAKEGARVVVAVVVVVVVVVFLLILPTFLPSAIF